MIGTTGQLAKLVGARLIGSPDLPIEAVVTDSRQAADGLLFVPVVGLNHDGHDFIAACWRAGLRATLCAPGALEQRGLVPPPDGAVLEVASPLAAYGTIGAAWRERFPDVLMIGITGSLGKTSTKEFCWQILSERGPVLRNPSSFNNEVGVPATLLQLRPEHWAAVQELGMRGPGEIAALCKLVRPSVGLITNIGHSHVGRLGSRQAIAQAKGELLSALGPDGIAVLNADDPHAAGIAGLHSGRIVWHGSAPQAEVRSSQVQLLGLSGSRWLLEMPTGTAWVELPVAGEHMVANARAAAALGYALGFGAEAIAAALGHQPELKLRGEVLHLASGARLINDAYNSAPESLRAALSILLAEPTDGRRVVVLGGMAELGDLSSVEHLRLGRELGQAVDLLVTVGPEAVEFADGAEHGSAAIHRCADQDDACAWLAENLRSGDLVLLKGSRVFELERLAQRLEKA